MKPVRLLAGSGTNFFVSDIMSFALMRATPSLKQMEWTVNICCVFFSNITQSALLQLVQLTCLPTCLSTRFRFGCVHCAAHCGTSIVAVHGSANCSHYFCPDVSYFLSAAQEMRSALSCQCVRILKVSPLSITPLRGMFFCVLPACCHCAHHFWDKGLNWVISSCTLWYVCALICVSSSTIAISALVLVVNTA